MIVDEIIQYVRPLAKKKRLEDVRLGLGYTAVLLDDKSCGVSFTFAREVGGCGYMDEAGTLAGMEAEKAIEWAMDVNLAKAAVGIATINALTSQGLSGYVEKNAIDEIDIRPGDVLGMVGYFLPVLQKRGPLASKAYVFDRYPSDNVLPDWAEEIYLPRCDVVIVTGTTLLNKTVDHVLSLCTKAREVVLMGPTTCLVPSVFKKYGVTLLAGSKVTNAKKALQAVSEGGGGLHVKDFAEYLCIRP